MVWACMMLYTPSVVVLLGGARKAREGKMSPEASKTLLVMAGVLLAGWVAMVLNWM